MSRPQNNDAADLIPRTVFDGPRMEIDFPALRIGVAEYDEGPTGCTVLAFPHAAIAVADIGGGSPGAVNANVPWGIDALCFTGGSGLGLQSIFGVADELFAERNHEVERQPVVAGSCIFDFATKSRSSVYPDRELGRAAVRSAQPGSFLLGGRGAGRSATCGKAAWHGETSGQGAAIAAVGSGRVAVFTVVNALGVVVDRDGTVRRGNYDPATGTRSIPTASEIGEAWAREQAFWQQRTGSDAASTAENTTVTAVVTDLRIPMRAMKQMARQIHASMSRAIQPFNAPADGDALWVVSTAAVENQLGPTGLAVLASELAWDAVLSAGTDLDDPGTFVPRYP